VGHPLFDLAAAAVIVAAAVVSGVVVIAHAIIAAAAEQDQQDDDPAHIPTAETVITHNKYLQILMTADSRLIPRYSAPQFLCVKTEGTKGIHRQKTV
jgi:hypothetical protein